MAKKVNKSVAQTFVFGEDGQIDSETVVEQQPEDQQIKTERLSPFDFVNAINYSKVDMFPIDPQTGERLKRPDSEYVKFIINRAMSYFPDTIMFANAANQSLNNVPNECHFDFYRYGVSKRKRFAKWAKPVKNDDIDLICKYYGYSIDKAVEVIDLLGSQKLAEIRAMFDHGGRRNK